MRLTQVVWVQFRNRLKDYSWQRYRKPAINDLGTEKKLREQGIEIVDANEFVQDMDKELYPRDWQHLSDAKPWYPQPPTADRNHPDWHNEPILMFDAESFPMEGVNQAQAFTKSVQIKQGLPEALLGRCQFTKLQNPEAKAERIVQQAFLWDACLENLPNLQNFDYPTRKFRRPIGIPAKRSNDILVRNFLRLMEYEDPTSAVSRMISGNEEFRLNVKRHGSNVQLKLSPLLSVMSKKPVEPFLKIADAQKQVDQEVPNIYPFLSTANFDENNIYKPDDFFVVKSDSTFSNIHTAVFSHHIAGSHTHIHPRWNDDRFAGATVMYAFATAAVMAHRRFGNSQAVLPEPITSQVLHLTGKEFQFAVFQLNTLDLDDTTNSKTENVVWLTDKMNLFDHVENKLGTEILDGYNAEPFTIFKGMLSSPTL